MIPGLKISDKDEEGNYTYTYSPNFPKAPHFKGLKEVPREQFENSLYSFTAKILMEVFENYELSDHNKLMEAARDIPRGKFINLRIDNILQSDTMRAVVEGMHFMYQTVGDLYNALQNEADTVDKKYVFMTGPESEVSDHKPISDYFKSFPDFRPQFFERDKVNQLKVHYEHDLKYSNSKEDYA